MRITKKLRSARAAFKGRVIDGLKARGAAEHDGLYDLALNTPIGEIGISVWDSAIMCRLWNVEAGRKFTEQNCAGRTCNPYSGKWNWHFSDDATTLNAQPEAEFFFYLDKLLNTELPENLASLTPEQHESCAAYLERLSLSELRRRQDMTASQITAAHRQHNDKALTNLHVREDHLRLAIDRKVFGK